MLPGTEYHNAATQHLGRLRMVGADTGNKHAEGPSQNPIEIMFLLKLIIRNAFRHRLRAVLTVIGVAVAILAFGLLRTLVSLWYLGVESSSSTRLVTRSSISLVFSLPVSYQERIRHIQGVTTVSTMNWFGGIYISEKNFFPNFAVEPKTFLELYPEFLLPEETKTAFFADRRGAVGSHLGLRRGNRDVDLRGGC